LVKRAVVHPNFICFLGVKNIIEKHHKLPYSIDYEDYNKIQTALCKLVDYLNNKANGEYKLKSRIELNALLWVEPKRRNID
jgi:hypothetical protein